MTKPTDSEQAKTEPIYLVPDDVTKPIVTAIDNELQKEAIQQETSEQILSTILTKSIQRSEQLQKEIDGLQELIKQEQEYQDRLRADFRPLLNLDNIKQPEPEPELYLFVGARCELHNGVIVEIIANDNYPSQNYYPFKTRGLCKEVFLTSTGRCDHKDNTPRGYSYYYDVKKVLNPQDKPPSQPKLYLFAGAKCELHNGAIVDIVANDNLIKTEADYTISQHYPFKTHGLGTEVTLTADGRYNHTPGYSCHYDVKKILNPQDRPNKDNKAPLIEDDRPNKGYAWAR